MKVTIDGLNHEGKGIAKIDNKITFINNAITHEEVEIEITKSHKSFNKAKVTKYIKRSESREDISSKKGKREDGRNLYLQWDFPRGEDDRCV